MAIAEMEKLELSVKALRLDDILLMIQKFQGVHIETGGDATIPQESKAVIDREIRAIEKHLQELQSAINILKGLDQTAKNGLFGAAGEKQLSITELTRIVEESRWEQIAEDVIHTDRRLQNSRTRRREVLRLLDVLKIWEALGSDPLQFKSLQRAATLFGSVHVKHAPDFTELLSKSVTDGLFFERVTEIDDRAYFHIVYHNDLSGAVSALTNEFSFSLEEYPFDKAQARARQELEAEEAALVKEERDIGDALGGLSVNLEILRFAEDYNLNLLLRKKKSLEITYDGDNVIITGWIVTDKRGLFEKTLAGSIPADDYSLSIRQVAEKDIPAVPIKLKNNALVSVYERLTEMYSLPGYNELDPTPVLTVFYMCFYGLMVADIGYGLAVFLIGLLVRRVFKFNRSTRGFVDFLYYLSFPMMAWGAVYGSMFGYELPFGLISVRADIIQMTVLSIVMGYVHIMAGLVLHMINKAKLRLFADMLTGGLAWFMAFLGGGVMLLTMFVPALDIGAVFYAGLAVTIAGLGMIVVIPAVTYGRRWYAGVGKGLYTLYGATSYLGDFVSYTSLMALGVAGGSVANAFNTILAFLPPALRVTLGIVLAVALHALNIFLSMLSAYVHGIRLQFIEFFNKFYTGGGRKFEPFKAAEKNVIITDILHE